jgi:hypothetical protein
MRAPHRITNPRRLHAGYGSASPILGAFERATRQRITNPRATSRYCTQKMKEPSGNFDRAKERIETTVQDKTKTTEKPLTAVQYTEIEKPLTAVQTKTIEKPLTAAVQDENDRKASDRRSKRKRLKSL